VNTHARISAYVQVEIGDQSGLAAFSAIHDHHHRFDLQSPWQKREYEGAPVRIGRGVAILARVAITEGVTIGDYAVVGANSVVTRDLPARSFCAGAPARVIRQGDA
jgi:acetyltransferase-like isoleucine patch superfamily enzyme